MPTYKKAQDGVNGCVYFFRIHGTDHVFIGTSTTNNPRMRYGQLSRLVPYKLDLVGWIRTGTFLDMQTRLRSEFASSHMLNGWYNLPPDVLSTTFSRESGADVSEVKDMVLKGLVLALDAVWVVSDLGDNSEATENLVENFLEDMNYDKPEVLFSDALRSYIVLVGDVKMCEFKRQICELGYKMTYDNKGFYAKKVKI